MSRKTKTRFLPVEHFYHKRGFRIIAGLDESGRGPFAGPVVCAAVILKKRTRLPGLNDCKLVTAKKREKLYEKIIKTCDYGISVVSAGFIDKYGLVKACEAGFKRAYGRLKRAPDILLIDGNDHFHFRVSFKTFIKGDRKIRSIAAASILTKVYRDRIMVKLSKKYPKYRFDLHKGYGTRLHRELLNRHGPSPVHRMRFRPVFEAKKVAQLPLR